MKRKFLESVVVVALTMTLMIAVPSMSIGQSPPPIGGGYTDVTTIPVNDPAIKTIGGALFKPAGARRASVRRRRWSSRCPGRARRKRRAVVPFPGGTRSGSSASQTGRSTGLGIRGSRRLVRRGAGTRRGLFHARDARHRERTARLPGGPRTVRRSPSASVDTPDWSFKYSGSRRQGSSVVEQGTHKPLVGSSTLPPGTTFI